jgi:hypothetical protein
MVWTWQIILHKSLSGFKEFMYIYGRSDYRGDVSTQGHGLTFEDVWAMFQETDKRFKETDRQFKESERLMQKNWEEMERFMRESREETDRQLTETDRHLRESKKELDRKMGKLDNRFGELAEHFVAPSINEKFNALGYQFDAISSGRFKIADPEGKILAELDILLQNTECMIGVEVKSKVRENDIEEHVERLEILRQWAAKHHDQRKIRSAMAGAIFDDKEKRRALKAGFYVIVQTGDT